MKDKYIRFDITFYTKAKINREILREIIEDNLGVEIKSINETYDVNEEGFEGKG